MQCSNNEREDGSTNEQEDSSTNEKGLVTGLEISTVEGTAFTIEGNPASNVKGLGRMQVVAEVLLRGPGSMKFVAIIIWLVALAIVVFKMVGFVSL